MVTTRPLPCTIIPIRGWRSHYAHYCYSFEIGSFNLHNSCVRYRMLRTGLLLTDYGVQGAEPSFHYAESRQTKMKSIHVFLTCLIKNLQKLFAKQIKNSIFAFCEHSGKALISFSCSMQK